MFTKILNFLGLGNPALNADIETRRKYIRHSGVHADVTIGDRAYNIQDWSMGGVSFIPTADARIHAGDKIDVTLKFRFPHGVITIEQQARIVRTARQGVAAEFAPLPKATRREFERVIDSLHAQEFLESQIA